MHPHPHKAGPKMPSRWKVHKKVTNARVLMKGILPLLVRFVGLVVQVCKYKRFFSWLGCSSWPSTVKIFSSSYTILLLLHLHEETNEPTKEGPLSYVLQESPFATVSRGHFSLVLSGCISFTVLATFYFFFSYALQTLF
jgi:hypothetical protein